MQRGSGATLVFLRLVTGEAGRTTVAGKVAYETVVRSVGRNLDLSSVDVVELPRRRIGGAHVKKYFDVGAGDECRASSSAGGSSGA